jgi:DNA-directed RNA polymerase subunit RPC12/RpoP
MTAALLTRTLDDDVVALLAGESSECLVCGEPVESEGERIECAACGSVLERLARPKPGQLALL